MKINKKDKGWILEELEKKNECLDANDFGGENPEDVEKQREKNEKEINKRFTQTEKNAKKVVGDDHEEKGKPMKEYLENKKDLSKFINKLKEQNIHYTISRSDKADYRYIVEYYRDKNVSSYRGIKIQFNEGKYLVHFEDGELLEATSRKDAKQLIANKLDERLVEDDMELLELPEEEPLPDAVPDEPIVISTEVEPEVEENAIYMALSGELRDSLLDIENLKSLVVTFADKEDDETINTLNSIIDDRTIHSGLLQGLMDKYNTPVGTSEEPKSVDEPEVKDESLKESKTITTKDGDEIDLFDTYEEAHKHLEDYAKENNIKYYDIVEDNYEVPHGLLFIEYEDEKQENEKSHYPLVAYKSKTNESLGDDIEKELKKYSDDFEYVSDAYDNDNKDIVVFATRNEEAKNKALKELGDKFGLEDAGFDEIEKAWCISKKASSDKKESLNEGHFDDFKQKDINKYIKAYQSKYPNISLNTIKEIVNKHWGFFHLCKDIERNIEQDLNNINKDVKEDLNEELEAGDCAYHPERDEYYYLKKTDKPNKFELYTHSDSKGFEVASPRFIDKNSPFYNKLKLHTKNANPEFKESLKESSFNGYACKPYDNLSAEEEQIRHELEWDLGAKEDKMGTTLSHAYDDMMRDYKYVRGNDNAMNKLMKAFNISKEDLIRYIDYKQDGLLVPKDHHKTR